MPVKLLKEGEGHVVTAELKSGDVYRGLLVESEDTMNVHLSDVTHTARNGKVSKLEQVRVGRVGWVGGWVDWWTKVTLGSVRIGPGIWDN